MGKLNLNKNDIFIKGISTIIENYCEDNNISKENLLKIQLVCEEFLTNILFPNFDGEVEFFISNNDIDTTISFSYLGSDFINKIDDSTFLSLKILQNKTKNIKSKTQENKTTVEFVI